MEACFNCGSTQFQTLYLGKDRMFGFPGEFEINKCTFCGQISTHPALSSTQIEEYYPDQYLLFTTAIEDEKNWFKRLDREHGVNLRCRAVISNSIIENRGRILDIGCATGVFLHGMQKLGWDSFGIEPSVRASEYAMSRFNLNIYTGYLEENQYEDSYFDAITLWDVFEHLPSPIETLRTINKILKPGGLLLITTPNIDSWSSLLFKKYWAGWECPRHYHVYSPVLLNDLFKKTGFVQSKLRSFTGNFGSSLLSFQFYLNDRNISTRSRQKIFNFFGSVPFRALTYPYFKLVQISKKGSSMTVFAHKKGMS